MKPKLKDLTVEGIKSAFKQPVATLVTSMIVAIVCFIVLATTGQNAAQEQKIISRIDGTGTRLITAVDEKGDGHLNSNHLTNLSGLNGVQWVFALGNVIDVANQNFTTSNQKIAARPFYGNYPEELELITGRWPRAGESLAGIEASKTLALADGIGVVRGKDDNGNEKKTVIVGTFQAQGALEHLNNVVLLASEEQTNTPISYLYVLAKEASQVKQLEENLKTALPARNPESIKINAPSGAAELQKVIAGDLGANSRQTMALVLGVGLAIISVSLFGAVAGKRRDYGRRRAIGATRSTLMFLILTQTLTASLIGICIGLGAGLTATQVLSGSLPSTQFIAGVAVMNVLIALLAAVPPALKAAWADPVAILRVP